MEDLGGGDSDNASEGDEGGGGGSTPLSAGRGLTRKIMRGTKRKRYGRNYSEMVVGRKHVRNTKDARKNEEQPESDDNDLHDESGTSRRARGECPLQVV